MIIAAADGSSLNNPGPAGWAWYIDDDCWAAGGWPMGTNNMGELQAVLDLLRQTSVVAEEPLRILCDSQYVINSLTKWLPGWKRKGWRKADGKPVLNRDLLEALDEALAGRDVAFEWVRGHAGHAMNEAADERARAFATALRDGVEGDRGPGFTRGTGARVASEIAPGASPRAERRLAETRRGDARSADAVPAETGLTEVGSADAWPADAGPADTLPLDFSPVAGDGELLAVVELEKSLLTDKVRSNRARMRVLLHPDFTEFGSSGRVQTRARTLAEVGSLPTKVTFEPIGADRLAEDVILLRWRAVAAHAQWLRSSVWQRVDGQWRLLFTQGTSVPK